MRKYTIVCFALLFLSTSIMSAPQMYESLWTTLLQENVVEGSRKHVKGNLVKYKNITQSQSFSSLIRHLILADPSKLNTRDEQLSFWINMYNIAVVHTIAQHYPLASIKDAGTLMNPIWDRSIINVGGNYFSLSEIETKILKKLNEPRLYYALCNGTLSSADLRNEAYTAKNLDQQLQDQKTNFLQNKTKGIRRHKGTRELRISSLFKWQKEFITSSSPLKTYLQPFADYSLKGYKISYLTYNWAHNGAKK